MTLLRRLRAFGSDLLLVPTMWRYLVFVARKERATERALKTYRDIEVAPVTHAKDATLGLPSLSREVG